MPDGIRPKYTPKNFKTLRKKIGEYVYDLIIGNVFNYTIQQKKMK